MKSFILAFLLLIEFSISKPSLLPDLGRKERAARAKPANIVFKSTDGGRTWQDIGGGLPENLQADSIKGSFTNESGLFLHIGNGLYQSESKSKSTSSYWKKELFLSPDKLDILTPGKSGVYAYNYNGHFIHKMNGTSAWLPVYTDFPFNWVYTVFETDGGTVFISAFSHLFKSVDGGKTWKIPVTNGIVYKMVESNGVLLAAGAKGILRSTDDGENWTWVIKENSSTVERINGGFAAVTYNAASNSRRIRASYDGGKTWQAIDAGLPADHRAMASIIQVGENFFCGHPKGIYKSSDKGKTWKLLLPSINGKVYNLSASGNVIYAISRRVGC